MQTQAFDPLNLTEEASLNSLELRDLPGADASWVGRRAFEVLSLHALADLAGHTDAAVVGWLAEHASASEAVRVFGRRLGHLIASLTVEPGAGPSAHGWRRAFLEHWLTVEQVWLAGGVVAGLGAELLGSVRSEAARLGGRVRIQAAPHAGELALVGAARAWPGEWGCAAVLDCGHSAIKRAVALASQDGLRQLVLLPPCPTAVLGDEPRAAALTRLVAECILETLQAARGHGEPDSLVRLSLASYVRGGQPISPRGIYGRLRVQRLNAELQARAGAGFQVRIGHDGSLAAAGLPDPGPRSAVIVIGTYLGSGFPPPADRLLPIAPDVNVPAAD